jgi:hypothetical protein
MRFYHEAPKIAEIVRRVDAERRLAELWMFPRCEPPSRFNDEFTPRFIQ